MKASVAFLLPLLFGCGDTPTDIPQEPISPEPVVDISLQQVIDRGKLVILSQNSATSYFIYKGETMGFEFELAEDFAKYLGVDLEVKIAHNVDEVLTALEEGSVDLVAANLTVTKERAEEVYFSEPIYFTHQVLVQKKPDNWKKLSRKEKKEAIIDEQVELIGESVYVRRHSSFYSRLESLSDEIGGPINIVEVQGDLETEELIRMVSEGEIPLTVADENVALINESRFDNLDVSLPLSLTQQIAWATRKDASELQQSLDAWLIDSKKTGHVEYVYNKYHRQKSSQIARVESDYSSLAGGKISPYDEFLKQHCTTIPWDWRMLSALIYEESKFDNNKRSWAGAFGIMQLMPNTASRYGIDSTANAEQNMLAGIDKLRRSHAHWSTIITDSAECDKFILAAYNAGQGHLEDAIRLAEKLGYDPMVWDDNVEAAMLLKAKPKYYNDEVVKYGYCRGTEPVKYVREVIARYEAYQDLIP